MVELKFGRRENGKGGMLVGVKRRRENGGPKIEEKIRTKIRVAVLDEIA